MKRIPIKKKVGGYNINPETLIMKTIGYALVDDKHYAELNQYTWTLYNGYVRRHDKEKRNVYMHHDVWHRLESRPYARLDHANRNRLNNQLSNIRPATDSQSNANRGLFVNSTTGYKGVSWYKRTKKYQANIKVNSRPIHLGYFSTAVKAAKAYDKAAIKYFDEFAVTNKALGLL